MNIFDILGPVMVGASSSHNEQQGSAILQESCWGANRKKQGSD